MADEKQTALVPHDEPQLPEIVEGGTLGNFDDLMEDLQRRGQLIQLAKYAVAHTTKDHWCEIHGEPFLKGHGSRWVARLIGIDYRPVIEPLGVREEHWDNLGVYYLWTFWVESTLKLTGDVVTEEGSCSSRDDFFATWKDKSGKKHWRELHEIDESDIKNTAYSNAVSRSIKAVLGIGVMSKQEINQLRGTADAFKAGSGFGKKTDQKKTGGKKSGSKPKPKSDEHPNAPPAQNGKFNKMKQVQEFKKFLMDNRICADIASYREFVAGVLTPEKCQFDELGEAEVIQGWDKSDVDALWAAAKAKVEGTE